MFKFLPCLDSDEMAIKCKESLRMPRSVAKELGKTAVFYSKQGYYLNGKGEQVNIKDAVKKAIKSKVSIPPDMVLPESPSQSFSETYVQVTNESTFSAAKRLTDEGLRPLALNFANGIYPGGGFLNGAIAQEETLCRSSALYLTLEGDEMYECHKKRPLPDSTDWAILSPDVPVFREDNGSLLDRPWLLSFISCAAPVAYVVGLESSRKLLKKRVHRVLSIAKAYGYSTLVLGAWGCGAFKNDPFYTASDFREVLESDFGGAFEKIIFAICDWSPERRFLKPFCDVFS